jgi:hypothetical protein
MVRSALVAHLRGLPTVGHWNEIMMCGGIVNSDTVKKSKGDLKEFALQASQQEQQA